MQHIRVYKIVDELGINCKPLYENEKIKGNILYMKYKIKSGTIDTSEFNTKLNKFRGIFLERDFNGVTYAHVTDLKALVIIKNSKCYLKILFVNPMIEDGV